MLDNNDDFFGNLHQTIAHEHNGQQCHSLHQMGLGKAEDRALEGQNEADNGFGSGDEVPRHVGASANIIMERKGNSEEDHGGHGVKNDLQNDGDTSSRIFPQLEEGSEILNGEAKSRYHEDES